MLLVCKVINVVTWLRGYWCHCINHSTAFSKQLTAVEFVFFFFGRSISSRALKIPSFRVLEWSWASGFPENLLLLRLFSPLCLDFIYQYLSLDSVTKEHISLPCFPFFSQFAFAFPSLLVTPFLLYFKGGHYGGSHPLLWFQAFRDKSLKK